MAIKQLKFNIEESANSTIVLVSGFLNESAEEKLKPIAKLKSKQITFNLKGVEMINSLGTKAWVVFLEKFAKEHDVTFEECSEEVVCQMNMVPSFAKDSQIASVFGSVMCPSCENTKQMLFKEGKNLSSDESEFPDIKCRECDELMQLEEDVEEYFDFLNR